MDGDSPLTSKTSSHTFYIASIPIYHLLSSQVTEAFSVASLNDPAPVSGEPRVGLNEDAESLDAGFGDYTDNLTTTSSSSAITASCSSSYSSEDVLDYKDYKGKKQKRVIAATGTISTVLGKDYVRSSLKRDSRNKFMEFDHGKISQQEAEQFLCSMLGDECELSMAVVRDVLCQCGYDVEKALNVLLDLTAASSEQSGTGRYSCNGGNFKQDFGSPVEQMENLIDRASDSTSYSSESEFQESIWSFAAACSLFDHLPPSKTRKGRNDAKFLAGSKGQAPQSSRSIESDLPQTLLETLFNVSRSHEYEPSTMNWRSMVEKMQSLGPAIDVYASSCVQDTYDNSKAKDDYQLYRKNANQHWDSMKSYYHKATAAYAKGERNYASYLSEQGRAQNRQAQKADDKASHNIFIARNRDIENVITIDLHGQHVKQAMRLLKMHLLFGSYVPSIQSLRVITGCGSHGVGKSKLKTSVIKLLENEGIKWNEENRGTILIKLSGYREFNFLDSNSDTE
ncbi:SMR domain-containing protein At5g58720 isoform X2 [Momordica charantia]|uniref:SMR domain-containing protein At5g58720 isoform X2 n=1 Tax=Momordica charantia TaxID=3673 RepID=A0A6J1D3R1_MOMCH|nr:SMR domain-containing protein At5g58720 isoform X2 [Momordica charantia]